MRHWQAPHGKWLHLRLGLITVCGKPIRPTWITVRQSPPPEPNEICPACQRREGFRAVAPYINDIRVWAQWAPDTLGQAISMAAREQHATA